jgi:predicted MFS family arabinose efflux permease
LDPEERKWIETQLEAERASKRIAGHVTMAEGLRQPRVWLLALAHFLLNLSGYGFILWLPTIVQRTSGLPVSLSNLCSAIPFGLAVITALVVSRSSDRTGRAKDSCVHPDAVGAVRLASLNHTRPAFSTRDGLAFSHRCGLLQLESTVLANPDSHSGGVGGGRFDWTH